MINMAPVCKRHHVSPVQRGTAIRLAEFKKLAAGKNFKNLKK